MRLNQMFPKQTLDAEDLNAYSPTGAVVTIEHIDYKTVEANEIGEAGLAYYVKFREFKKPVRLNKTNAYAIGDLLGSDDTDNWVGKTVNLLPVQIAVTDRSTKKRKRIWTFDIDAMAPQTPPRLGPNTDITGQAAYLRGPNGGPSLPPAGRAPIDPAQGELTPIGVDVAAQVVATFRERGQSVETFLRHMGSVGMADLIHGKAPPEWPRAVLAAARRFSASFPKSQAPMAPSAIEALKDSWRPPPAPPATEVVDRKTGEVINPAAPTPPPGDGRPEFVPIEEDDIPF